MTLIKIPNGLTQKVGRQILNLKKSSPRFLFISGLAGIAVSTVLACRATLKLSDTLDDFKSDIDAVNDERKKQELNEVESSNYHKDMAYVYAKGTGNLIKLYGPTLLIASASVGALTSSHLTLSRRNVALTGAYSALSASLDAYRERVRKEVGEEKEVELYQGIYKKELTVDGKIQSIQVADPNGLSIYARFFDEASPNWRKDPELNKLFVQCQQNYYNHLLVARGHVFLNEVYDSLGIDRSTAGQIVGWVVGNGDNFIDFGIFKVANTQFVAGWERSILLDFNVDGVIFDKI